jgi:tripartite-type tricarboxylate transporter receptor subunit TctC
MTLTCYQEPKQFKTGRRRLIGLAMLALCGVTAAQDLAIGRPVKLIVGYPPGGSNDIVARIVAPRLAELLGTPVVVENKAGANGVIGADSVAKSAPDGQTLLAASASPLVIAPHLQNGRAPFDTRKDLLAINTLGRMPEVIAVNPSLQITTLSQLLALARTKPVTLASSGNGGLPHLTIELLKQASRGNIVHVPYKGAGPAMADVIAGHTQGIVMDLPPLYPLLQDGRLTPLAVTSERRVEFLPKLPTAEEELPGFQVSNWIGLFAPARTPRSIVDKLNAALIAVMARQDVKDLLHKAAVTPGTLASPEAFQTFVNEEFSRWERVVKSANVQVDN